MSNRIRLHLDPTFDKTLLPVPATRHKDWWEHRKDTQDHARHCLPLTMANSLGYYILSPGTFMVSWDGDREKKATVQPIERSSHYEVDNHAAFASFTVQAKFIPVTDDPGEFVYVKGIPNELGLPYVCMEACIEAWWNVGNFGIVYLLNQPGQFIIYMGQPIAQIFLYRGIAGAAEMEVTSGLPTGNAEWLHKRNRPGYRKDYDYMKGLKASGEKIPTHITNWKDATKFQ